MNGSVLYAKFEGLSEAGPADQGIIYCFPKEENILSQIRGIFFTLSHLLSTVSSTPPKRYVFLYSWFCRILLF